MKCAVITPVGPGHQELCEHSMASVVAAVARGKGGFEDIVYIKIDDTAGRLGRSAARNMGIDKALSMGVEWIFFLDADDLLHENAFVAAEPFLATHDAIWGQICEIPRGGSEPVLRAGQATAIAGLDRLLAIPPFYSLQMGHFVRTSIAAAVRFDVTMDTGEDFKYYLSIWSDFRCVKTGAIFFVNRRGSHSTGPRSATGQMWASAVQRIVTDFPKSLRAPPAWAERGDYAVVVAHPDDEVLWFGPALERAKRVIVCYGDYAPRPSFGPARRAVFAESPLSNMVFLDLPEPQSFGMGNWRSPALTSVGLALTDAAAAQRYTANFRALVAALGPLLTDVAYVFTHNPWGEYGHEDHIQVALAVQTAVRDRGSRLFVPTCFARKSAPLMTATIAMLGAREVVLPGRPGLTGALKQLYVKHGCWTWRADWEAPETSRFCVLRTATDTASLPSERMLTFLTIDQ